MFKIMVTGHRPDKLFGYNIQDKKYDKIRYFLDVVLKKATDKYSSVEAISGMALGIDTIFAQEALKLNIPLAAYIPFEGQDSIWRKDSREEYRRILSLASSSRIIVDSVKKSDRRAISLALHERNHAMVHDADLVIAIWNGDKFGGTYECVRYAQGNNKKILYFNPITCAISQPEIGKDPSYVI